MLSEICVNYHRHCPSVAYVFGCFLKGEVDRRNMAVWWIFDSFICLWLLH